MRFSLSQLSLFNKRPSVAAAGKQSQGASRLAFIDWTRGLAALVMLQGHTFDSFTAPAFRDKGPFLFSQFLGGMPPAFFLFLTGITYAFLMDSQEKKVLPGWRRVTGALKRSRYLFLLAFLFRIQLYVFGFPDSPANELLRVDILNCMGFAMLMFAPMAVFTTRERTRLCTVLGLVVAFLAPLIPLLDGPALPSVLRAYFMPSLTAFGFFPWACYLAFGMAAGSAIRLMKQEDYGRGMLWMFGLGLGLITAAHYCSDLPYSFYPTSDYWLDSPALAMTKLGVVMVVLGAAYLWVNAGVESQRWSLFRQLGTTSLLVYWVHIELVYGRWLGMWKQALTVPQVLMATTGVILLMAVLSVARTRYASLLPFFQTPRLPEPQRVSGD